MSIEEALTAFRPILLPPSVLELGQFISKGSNGRVLAAKLRGVTPVAAKTLHQLADPDIYDEEALRNAERSLMTEASMLVRLKHPNIIQLMGIVMADDTLTHPKYLLMEPADMSLGWRLVQPAVIRLYALWRLMVDMFSALTYMHAIHAVHGDIKPENILLFNDGQGGYIAKLGDVGEANRAGASALGRTPFYSAPELLGVIDAKLEPACDVYASGVVIAEVALQLLVSGPKCYLRDGIRKCYPMSDFVGMIDSAIDVVYQSSWEMGHLLRLCCSREQSHRLPARDVLTQLKSLKIEKYPQPPLWQLKAEEDCIRNKDGSVALCRVETCGNQLRGSLVPTNFKKYKGYCKPCGDAMESARSARTATAHESIASQADRPHREGVIDPVVPPAVPDTTEDVSMSDAASQARQPPDSEENRCTTSSMDD